MGRGRAKAKQIKVARKLKYSAPSTDLSALERELRGGSVDDTVDDTASIDDESEEDDDPYAGYVDDDYGSWAADGHG